MRTVVLVSVLAVATAAGLLWRWRDGRIGEVRGGVDRSGVTVDRSLLASLGVDPEAAPVTLVQFSSAFCQPCRATRQVLARVTQLLPAVRHVEVDAESHLDAVRALGVLRTPTVLVVDRAGRVVRRASGLPRTADVVAAVAPLLTDGGRTGAT
jgi:thiol-disulfide isomerase/thioredoxin